MMVQNQPDKKIAADRILKLREFINDYRYRYHVLDESTMSEAAADSLKHELSQLEEKYPDLITPDSPTQRVAGSQLPGFSKVTHKIRMISLNDVFSPDEVEDWIKRTQKLSNNNNLELFTDIKMDGLACSLIFQDGLFTQAVTRGDGLVGEDVTNNVRTIKNIPLRLRKSSGFEQFLVGRTEIRGEIVMLKKDFEELNKKRVAAGEPEFANPRNLAAGTIRQLDPNLVMKRPLRFRAYDILRDDPTQVPTNMYAYQVLTELGIERNQEACVFNGLDGVMKFVGQWDQKRKDLAFNTDGIVIKVNDRELFDKLGIAGKTPRAAVAFKYLAEKATTIVQDIVISIGRTGAATPVAVFQPVFIAGSTVQHASLHNSDEIDRLDVRVGDTVIIYKAGDIIPKVEAVVLELRPADSVKYDFVKMLAVQYPELEFERPDNEVVYRVKGLTAPIILKRSLEHFASKGALDIDTLGEKNVVALVDAGLVNDLADIYNLTFDSVVRLDRFADISAHKLINAVQSTTSPQLSKFIYGLGIRHVGAQTAVDLSNNFESIDALKLATIEQLRAIDGIGEVVSESIIAWFSDPDNEELLQKFASFGVKPQYVKAGGKLSGKSFVITGTLNGMSRDEAADKIRALGGVFQTATAKDTDYLVVGNSAGNSKIEKAKQYGTQIIDEAKLLDLIA